MGTTRTRWAVVALVATLALTGAACTAPPSPNTGGDGIGTEDGTPTEPGGDDDLRLNEVQFIGSHNSYKAKQDDALYNWLSFGASVAPEIADALGDPRQLNYEHPPLSVQLGRGLRTFELDVFADPAGGAFSQPLLDQLLGLGLPDPVGVDAPGMKVLHVQDIDYRSTCPTLVACLSELRDWSDATPGHLPIVINLELKDGELPAPFDATEITPFDATQLDAVDDEIRSVLGDRLITPDDVRGAAADLRSAIEDEGWPTLAESRGRFLFFMDNADKRTPYLDGHPSLEGRVMFTSSGEGQPDGAVLKRNDPGDGSEIRALVEQGYLVRTRADADVVAPDPTIRDVALASGAQIVHTDFPAGQSQLGTGYVVSFGTRVQARCNPVLTSESTCGAASLQAG